MSDTPRSEIQRVLGDEALEILDMHAALEVALNIPRGALFTPADEDERAVAEGLADWARERHERPTLAEALEDNYPHRWEDAS